MSKIIIYDKHLFSPTAIVCISEILGKTFQTKEIDWLATGRKGYLGGEMVSSQQYKTLILKVPQGHPKNEFQFYTMII